VRTLTLILIFLYGSYLAIAQEASSAHGMQDETAVASQEPAIAVTEPYTLGVGVKVGFYGGGITTQNAEGRKVNPDFWAFPAFGGAIYAPFGAGSSLAGQLDIGVSTNGTRTRPYEMYDGKKNWAGYFIERNTFFTLAPQVNFGGFLIGVGLNFPMSGKRWHPENSDNVYTVDRELFKSMIMDVRVGSSIPVWQSKLGKLTVDLSARYMFSGLYKDDQYIYGHPTTSLGLRPSGYATAETINFVPADIHLGVSYLFNVSF